jgi:hypothetical protein
MKCCECGPLSELFWIKFTHYFWVTKSFHSTDKNNTYKSKIFRLQYEWVNLFKKGPILYSFLQQYFTEMVIPSFCVIEQYYYDIMYNMEVSYYRGMP